MIRFIVFCALVTVLFACGGSDEKDSISNSPVRVDKNELLEKIAEYEEYAYGDNVRMDKTAGQQLMVYYQDYANNFHDDTISADYLFKAGEIARNLGKYRKAISLFENVHDGFPDYSKRPESAFVIAFIYDNDLNDREMAEKQYNKVIELFPGHKLAEDAAGRLQTLYMTDEEMLEFFKSKNSK